MPVRTFRRYARCQRGVAALEFALVSPFLILLLLGGFELSRFLLVQQKAEKVAFSVADVAAQYEDLGAAEIAQVFAAVEQVMAPQTLQADGLVFLSSVQNPEGQDTEQEVVWQCTSDGELQAESQVGNEGEEASLPAEFLLDDRDNIIVAEVFYRYTPIFPRFYSGPGTVYRTAMFAPGFGDLTAAPGC